MSELVSMDLIAEIKQYIVENLEYETGERVYDRKFFRRDERQGLKDKILDAAAVTFFGAAAAWSWKDLLDKREKSFSDELTELVRASGRSPAEVYNRAQINRQLYSKIISDRDYRPKKPTALALAIALELTLEQTKAFIARAGYALTRSSVTDLVVEFFIDRKDYNVMRINEVLHELDEPILGSVAKEDRQVTKNV